MRMEISQKINDKYNDHRGINLKVYTYEDIIKTINNNKKLVHYHYLSA